MVHLITVLVKNILVGAFEQSCDIEIVGSEITSTGFESSTGLEY